MDMTSYDRRSPGGRRGGVGDQAREWVSSEKWRCQTFVVSLSNHVPRLSGSSFDKLRTNGFLKLTRYLRPYGRSQALRS